MKISALTGVIRSGRPVISLHVAEEAAPTPIRFTFRGPGRTVAKIDKIWPTAFAFDDPKQPRTGRIVLEEAAGLDTYIAVKISAPDAAVDYGEGWSLKRLYPDTPEDFEKAWFKDRNRLKDRETLYFAARQINRDYQLDEAHRCVTAVIEGYSAIELGDPAACAAATAVVQAQLVRAADLPPTRLVRTDGPHQVGSLHCVLWHLLLHQGRDADFVEALDAYVDHLRTRESALGRTLLNSAMVILLRSYVHGVAGEVEQARTMADFCLRHYAASLSRIEPKSLWLREVRHPHNAVVLALENVERLEAGKPPYTPAEIMRMVNRVEGEGAKAVLIDRFERFCAAQQGRGY